MMVICIDFYYFHILSSPLNSFVHMVDTIIGGGGIIIIILSYSTEMIQMTLKTVPTCFLAFLPSFFVDFHFLTYSLSSQIITLF